MNCKKIVFLVGFLAMTTLIFNFGAPDAKAYTDYTAEELLEMIRELREQLAELQLQLAELTECYDFNVNLKIGDSGAAVTALQTALEKEGLYQRAITGSFDAYTASVVVAFQEKYADEILAPWGLTHGTGYVGSTTRAKLNKLYGCKEVCVQKGYACCLGNACVEVMITCTEGEEPVFKGCAANCSPQWECQPSTPFITVISPNGGETWKVGGTYDVTWASNGIDKVDISVCGEVIPPCGPCCNCVLIGDDVLASLRKYSWIIPSGWDGEKKKIRIRDAEADAFSSCVKDESDNYFSIAEQVVPYEPINVKNGEVFTIGPLVTNPSTGYGWQIDKDDNYLDLVDKVGISEGEPMPGKGGTVIFYFKALKAGKTTLTLTYCRSWECEESTAKTQYYAVTISTIKTCHPSSLWNWNYCSSGCKCGAYLGDCDINADCTTGYCAQDVGTKYGQLSTMDVCEERAEKSITVISPNGGERWTKGKTYNITWTSTGSIDKVGISILKNHQPYQDPSGAYMETAVTDNDGSYSWTVSVEPLGNAYTVKIEDEANLSVYDESDDYFNVVAEEISTCTDSDGGKDYYVKGTVTKCQDKICESVTDACTYCTGLCLPPDPCENACLAVREYYCEKGEIKSEISYCPSNCVDGACLKEIIPITCGDVNTSGRIDIGDVVLLRNYIAYPEQYPISSKWAADVNCDGAINVFDAVLLQNYVGYPGEYQLNCCSEKSITVISPNGGETWAIGKTHTIKWNSTGVDKVKIYLGNFDSGLECTNLCTPPPEYGEVCCDPCGYKVIADNVPASSGEYSWTIPTSQTAIAKAKIAIQSTAANGCPLDYGDNYFSIVPTVTNCTDSDGGKDYFIKGTAVGYGGATLIDSCCTDSNDKLCGKSTGSVLSEAYCQGSTADAVQYTCSYGCEDGACQAGITVISPNGGEEWTIGETYDISWASEGTNYSTVLVDIYLWRDGEFVKTIALGVSPSLLSGSPSIGKYSWTVPSDLTLGDKYQIKLSASGIAKSDTSDNYFSIVEAN
jgi:predicted secreted protein